MKEIVIDGERYVKLSDVKGDVSKKVNSQYVIVRTYSAGVFAGNLVSRNGKEVKLANARRLWQWYGASLSQIAMDGIVDASKCKFPCEVTEVILTEVIEIIPCTEKAIKEIKGVPKWTV